MGIFERFLSLWVALATAAGALLGLAVPQVFQAVAGLEYAKVNLVVAVLIWWMVFPMMLKVEPGCLADVGRRPKGILLTLVVNWLIKPFTLAALGVLFFEHVFARWISRRTRCSASRASSCSVWRRARPWCSCGASSHAATPTTP